MVSLLLPQALKAKNGYILKALYSFCCENAPRPIVMM